MSDKSAIEWTDATWNPVRGCTKVSPGCAFCYAETFAERWRGIPGHPYEQGFDLRLVEEKLREPLKWKKPRMIFVNSMSDLFHEDVPMDFLHRIFLTIRNCPQHIFQVLTKRADRMRHYVAAFVDFVRDYPHVWLGVSVENRKHGLPRIEELRETRCALRWLSIEPLLEDLGELDLTGIDWVVVGGESGAKARPFDLRWAQSILRQCQAAGVPYFLKQVGSRPVNSDYRNGARMHLKSRKGGDPKEWPAHLQVREMPDA